MRRYDMQQVYLVMGEEGEWYIERFPLAIFSTDHVAEAYPEVYRKKNAEYNEKYKAHRNAYNEAFMAHVRTQGSTDDSRKALEKEWDAKGTEIYEEYKEFARSVDYFEIIEMDLHYYIKGHPHVPH
jgi:hypothetical protein